MVKNKSCSRCKHKFSLGEPTNKYHGMILCNNCYPGIPPSVGRKNFKRNQEIEKFKYAYPEFKDEIDKIFKT